MLLGLSAGVPILWLGVAYLLMWGGEQGALGDASWLVNRLLPSAGALILVVAFVANLAERGGVPGRSHRT